MGKFMAFYRKLVRWKRENYLILLGLFNMPLICVYTVLYCIFLYTLLI